jgi:hypothetical protein
MSASATKPVAARSLFLRTFGFFLATMAAFSIWQLSKMLSHPARDRLHSFHTSTLHLASNGSFVGGSECALHFIWALAWGSPRFDSALSPPPPYCTSFPESYFADAPLHARAIASSHSSCLAILSLLLPLPRTPSLAAAAAYSCWHLHYLSRHFALMRRVAEAALPGGIPRPPLPFNSTAVLHLLSRITPAAAWSTPCHQSPALETHRELRCCLQDERCVRLHASQLTWVAVPQLIRTYAFTRRSAGAFSEVNEVSEAKLLGALEFVKAHADAAAGQHESSRLWANYVTMSALMPHGRRLRSPELDAAVARVTRGQQPGTQFAIFSEFSRCSAPTNVRYGRPIAQNLRANVKRTWGADAEVIFATFDKSCLPEAAQRARRNAAEDSEEHNQALPFVLYSRLTEQNLALSHCSRDMDSVTRALWTWEIVKRGASVVNSDPDVVFFRRIPPEYIADCSMALTPYTSPQLVYVMPFPPCVFVTPYPGTAMPASSRTTCSASDSTPSMRTPTAPPSTPCSSPPCSQTLPG